MRWCFILFCDDQEVEFHKANTKNGITTLSSISHTKPSLVCTKEPTKCRDRPCRHRADRAEEEAEEEEELTIEQAQKKVDDANKLAEAAAAEWNKLKAKDKFPPGAPGSRGVESGRDSA